MPFQPKNSVSTGRDGQGLKGEKLDGWLAEAEACSAPAMRNFAAGLKKDLAAVRVGLSEKWSNGPVERFVHKLKLIFPMVSVDQTSTCPATRIFPLRSASPASQSGQGRSRVH